MFDGCFGIGSDHEADAFDDYVAREEAWGDEDQLGFHAPRRKRSYNKPPSDPLYYHTNVWFKSIKAETSKCWLLKFSDGVEKWVPKSICRRLDRDAGCVYVHRATYNKIKPVATNRMQTKNQQPQIDTQDTDLSHDEWLRDWKESQSEEWTKEMDERYDRPE